MAMRLSLLVLPSGEVGRATARGGIGITAQSAPPRFRMAFHS